MIKQFLLICFLIILLNANEEDKFIKLFSYLENNNIIIGKDISTNKLYDMIEKNDIYLNNGDLNKKILNSRLASMLNTKKEQFDTIKIELEKNPNSKVYKEIEHYIDDSNNRVSETQQNINKSDNDGYFSSILNYVIGFMKN